MMSRLSSHAEYIRHYNTIDACSWLFCPPCSLKSHGDIHLWMLFMSLCLIHMLHDLFTIFPLAPCFFKHCPFFILFPAPFSFFCAPCSFLIFFLLLQDFPIAPCSFLEFSSAPCSFLSFWCSLLRDYHFLAPCSFTYFMVCCVLLCVHKRACSLLRGYP